MSINESDFQCESCNHFKTKFKKFPLKGYIHDDIGTCHNSKHGSTFGIEWLRYILIKEVGCASHTKFKPTHAFTNDELLEELAIRLNTIEKKVPK